MNVRVVNRLGLPDYGVSQLAANIKEFSTYFLRRAFNSDYKFVNRCIIMGLLMLMWWLSTTKKLTNSYSLQYDVPVEKFSTELNKALLIALLIDSYFLTIALLQLSRNSSSMNVIRFCDRWNRNNPQWWNWYNFDPSLHNHSIPWHFSHQLMLTISQRKQHLATLEQILIASIWARCVAGGRH